MIPYFDVCEAEVKYPVRATGGDQELYDILLTLKGDGFEGEEVRVFSDVKSDLGPYEPGDSAYLAHTPNGPQMYRLLNMPGRKDPIARQVSRKRALFMHIYDDLPNSIPHEARQDIATTIYLDQRDRGDAPPLEDSGFEPAGENESTGENESAKEDISGENTSGEGKPEKMAAAGEAPKDSDPEDLTQATN
jgi:hypothetical protein